MKTLVKPMEPLQLSEQVGWFSFRQMGMTRRVHERIYEPVWSKGAWSVLPISNVILYTWVAPWINKVGEGVSFATAGIVPAIEKAMLVPSKGSQTDIAPFMTANT